MNQQMEFDKTIILMRIAYEKYKTIIFKNKYLCLKSKLTLFTAFVSTVGLYGSATWCLTDSLISKLDTIHCKFLRSIVPGMARMSSYEDIILKSIEFGVSIVTIDILVKKRM